MEVFDAWRLTKLLHLIEGARRDGIRYEIDQGNRDAKVKGEFLRAWVNPILEDARELANTVELESTDSRVSEHGGFTLNLSGITYQDLDHELKTLRECVQIDLSTKFIYVIGSKKQEYLLKKFILKTWHAGLYFPRIRQDVFSAMRSYGYNLNTACVFHLMRITEIGLRALAKRMRVSLPRNKQLEWGQWQEIIGAMSKKTEALAISRSAGKAKDELLEFYRGAIGEFYGFKDAYRNFVMHMRDKSDYDEDEARSLIGRVSHFMNRLSEKIDEHGNVLTEARLKKLLAKMDAEIETAEKEKQKADDQAKQGLSEIRPSDAATDSSSA